MIVARTPLLTAEFEDGTVFRLFQERGCIAVTKNGEPVAVPASAGLDSVIESLTPEFGTAGDLTTAYSERLSHVDLALLFDDRADGEASLNGQTWYLWDGPLRPEDYEHSDVLAAEGNWDFYSVQGSPASGDPGNFYLLHIADERWVFIDTAGEIDEEFTAVDGPAALRKWAEFFSGGTVCQLHFYEPSLRRLSLSQLATIFTSDGMTDHGMCLWVNGRLLLENHGRWLVRRPEPRSRDSEAWRRAVRDNSIAAIDLRWPGEPPTWNYVARPQEGLLERFVPAPDDPRQPMAVAHALLLPTPRPSEVDLDWLVAGAAKSGIPWEPIAVHLDDGSIRHGVLSADENVVKQLGRALRIGRRMTVNAFASDRIAVRWNATHERTLALHRDAYSKPERSPLSNVRLPSG